MCGNSVCPPMAEEAYVEEAGRTTATRTASSLHRERLQYPQRALPERLRPHDHVETDAYTEPDAAQAVWNRRVTAGVEADAPHDPLRQAAEQFVASCKDGNVADLIDYYEEIFTEALGVAGTLNDQGEKA
jgi:hypothetical protein